MRYTTKHNDKNVIPLLNAVCGIDMPYWRIDRADDLHSYLSGDAADKLAAYEDAEEQGRLVARDMHGRPHYDRPQTNADRIRAMTDEEMDDFLGEVQWDVANYCGGVSQKQDFPVPEHRGAWLDWLKQEAEE